MKKLTILALALATAGTMSAQKDAVKQAAKLSGKPDKIEEARAILKGAMENPETANSAETYYTGGKVEFDAFDKVQAELLLKPDMPVDNDARGMQLLNAVEYFNKALELDQLPNEKGQVKPKYTKDMLSRINAHANDFYAAGANFFNTKKFYPEAYTAFEIFGNLDKYGSQIPDSVRGEGLYYAGLAAVNADKIQEAAKAFQQARANHYQTLDAYRMEIATWQQVRPDDALAAEAKANIHKLAKEGYEKFGMSQPLFFNNLVNDMIMEEKYDQAIATIQDAMAQNPGNANLTNLLAYTYLRANKLDEMDQAYRALVDCPDVTAEMLETAADMFQRLGTDKNNAIEGNSEADRAAKQAIYDNYVVYGLGLLDRIGQMDPDNDTTSLRERFQYLGNLLQGLPTE